MRVLGISGSLRKDSHNARLLRVAATALPLGAELEIWEGLAAVPPYSEDDEGDPAPRAVAGLRRAVAEADAVLISTPEYNSSIPGQLKNALDWLSRPLSENPLRNKPVAVIGASTGMFGAAWAQAELRKVLKAIGARVADGDLPVGRAHEVLVADARSGDARITDAELHHRLEELLAALVEEALIREQAGASRRVAVPEQVAA